MSGIPCALVLVCMYSCKAGGLNASNVAEAIQTVNFFGSRPMCKNWRSAR